MKRTIDILLSVILGIITSPVLLYAWIGIKLEDGGPFLYSQERTGLDGEVFTIYKIRSMADGRVTRMGKFIRKYRIDELPQLINVLNNDMSIVGPRPEQVRLVERYLALPHYHRRHFVKPGITGLAQVEHEYTHDEKGAWEKLKYDLHYVTHCSIMLDLTILLKTVKVVLVGKGSGEQRNEQEM